MYLWVALLQSSLKFPVYARRCRGRGTLPRLLATREFGAPSLSFHKGFGGRSSRQTSPTSLVPAVLVPAVNLLIGLM